MEMGNLRTHKWLNVKLHNNLLRVKNVEIFGHKIKPYYWSDTRSRQSTWALKRSIVKQSSQSSKSARKRNVPGTWQTNTALSGPLQNLVFHRYPDDGFTDTHIPRSLSSLKSGQTFEEGGMGVRSSTKLGGGAANEEVRSSLKVEQIKWTPRECAKFVNKSGSNVSNHVKSIEASVSSRMWLYLPCSVKRMDNVTLYLRPLKALKGRVLIEPDPNLVGNV